MSQPPFNYAHGFSRSGIQSNGRGNGLSLLHSVWASAKKIESTGFWYCLELLLLTYLAHGYVSFLSADIWVRLNLKLPPGPLDMPWASSRHGSIQNLPVTKAEDAQPFKAPWKSHSATYVILCWSEQSQASPGGRYRLTSQRQNQRSCGHVLKWQPDRSAVRIKWGNIHKALS